MPKSICVAAIVCFSLITLFAQSHGSARFDVVSIKRNASGEVGNSMRTLPDGTEVFVNTTIRSFLTAGAPEPVTDVVGFPDWVAKERYDVTAKAPEGANRRLGGEMLRNLLIDRMKLSGHIEEREQNTFAMVLVRPDGRLGPQLQPSTADCARRPGEPPPAGPPANPDFERGCFFRFGPGLMQGGATTLDSLAVSLRSLAGGLVNNRTGLTGAYKLKLSFRPPQAAPAPDDLPDIFTALQEQLGLKLVPEKTMEKVFAVDNIERTTEN